MYYSFALKHILLVLVTIGCVYLEDANPLVIAIVFLITIPVRSLLAHLYWILYRQSDNLTVKRFLKTITYQPAAKEFSIFANSNSKDKITSDTSSIMAACLLFFNCFLIFLWLYNLGVSAADIKALKIIIMINIFCDAFCKTICLDFDANKKQNDEYISKYSGIGCMVFLYLALITVVFLFAGVDFRHNRDVAWVIFLIELWVIAALEIKLRKNSMGKPTAGPDK